MNLEKGIVLEDTRPNFYLVVQVSSFRVSTTPLRVGIITRCQLGVPLHVVPVYWSDMERHFLSIHFSTCACTDASVRVVVCMQ